MPIWMGVLLSTRSSWVSVVIFVGMRFTMTMSSGRMSCEVARSSVITKMFSCSRAARAGRSEGMLMGMAVSVVCGWRSVQTT